MSELSSDCLFCRIVRGEIPASVVVETDRSLAFRDLHPQASTHVLVVPRRHLVHAGEITAADAADVADLFVTAQQVVELDSIAERGYRLVFNVGDDAGNSVPHLHLHVLGGKHLPWPPWAGSPAVPQ
jgi:histidine triad (HIT) family protein